MSGLIGAAGSRSGLIDDHKLKQYTMSVTATNWTTSTAIAIPYKTSNGYWWVRGNVNGTLSGYGSNNVFSLTTTGVTWINGSAFVTRHADAQANEIDGQGSFSTNVMVIVWNGVKEPNSVWNLSFDVGVASKPTWAD